MEVLGEFSHLIPQKGLSRMERGRKRQGLVPDFLPPQFEFQLNTRETLCGLFAAMGLPPIPPLKTATDSPRVFAGRLVGLPSWHAAVLLSTSHAREPKPKTTPMEPQAAMWMASCWCAYHPTGLGSIGPRYGRTPCSRGSEKRWSGAIFVVANIW